jgi:hypothetical protein
MWIHLLAWSPSGGSAEDWPRNRVHDLATADRIERAFRNHVYPAIGGYALRTLAKRPSLIQAWIGGLKVGPNTARTRFGWSGR